MSQCARGCCWTPFSCATARTCACHWEDRKPRSRNNGGTTYRDPTPNEAIRNIENERNGR